MTSSHKSRKQANYAIRVIRMRIQAGRTPLLTRLYNRVVAQAPTGMSPLRFAVVSSTPTALGIEATYFRTHLNVSLRRSPITLRRQSPSAATVVHVVPTSVGASIGGFAGDASPATRVLAAVSDRVITHPNVVNASDILAMSPNTLYVEGSFLDAFLLGQVALRPVRSNTIGIVIERQPQKFIDYVRYSIDAAHTTCGIPIAGYAVTGEKIGPRVRRFASGAYTGDIDNVETLLEAVEKLLAQGATAIAITSEIRDLPDLSQYIHGLEPNPHGGVEALLSHTVSRRYGLPSAHAPMWGECAQNEDVPSHTVYDPREAAELVTTTAIGCVLQGLHRAPQAVPFTEHAPGDITARDLLALVIPARAIGSIPALACDAQGIPVIGVLGNETIHQVNPAHFRLLNYHPVGNYFEAAGLIAALRCGVAPTSVTRPVQNIPQIGRARHG